MMKKLLFSVVMILSFTFKVFSPVVLNKEFVERVEIEPYSDLIYAVNMVEARIDSVSFDTFAVNTREMAVGAFQIRQCRLIDYNRRTGKNYKTEDLFDYDISKEIFLFYAIPFGDDHRTIAKKWNGSGPKTDIYWKKVQAYLK